MALSRQITKGASKCYLYRDTDDTDDPGEGVSELVQLLLERCLFSVLLRFLLGVVVVGNLSIFAMFWFRFDSDNHKGIITPCPLSTTPPVKPFPYHPPCITNYRRNMVTTRASRTMIDRRVNVRLT